MHTLAPILSALLRKNLTTGDAYGSDRRPTDSEELSHVEYPRPEDRPQRKRHTVERPHARGNGAGGGDGRSSGVLAAADRLHRRADPLRPRQVLQLVRPPAPLPPGLDQ